MQAAYYDRDVKVFGAYQRVLCNKCHAKRLREFTCKVRGIGNEVLKRAGESQPFFCLKFQGPVLK